MKQTVRREALAGIHEYYTDATAVRDAESEASEAFANAYLEQLEQEAVANRRLMLRGIDPATGVRYTRTQYRDLLDALEPTPEERHLVFMQLSMRSDFELEFLEDEERRAWQDHDGYCAPTREQDIAWLQEIGDASVAAMIARESRR